MNQNKPKVSIIIPIYNTQKYLKACLDSVANQSYHNIEVILVDDGSPDNSALIYEKYLNKFDNFKCIKQTNQGLSAARNSGIRQSTGEYIAFIDSDDIVSNYFIEVLVRGIIENDCDISCCSLCNFYSENESALINRLDSYNVGDAQHTVYEPVEFIKQVMYQKLPLIASCCKMCKREYIENAQFLDGLMWEDRVNVIELVMQVKKVAVCDMPLYGYRCQSSSLTNSVFKERHYDCIKIADIMEDRASEYGDDVLAAARCNIFNMFYTCFFNNAYTVNEARYKIWKYVRKYASYIRKDKNAKLYERCLAFLVIGGKHVFYIGMKCITWIYRRFVFVR